MLALRLGPGSSLVSAILSVYLDLVGEPTVSCRYRLRHSSQPVLLVWHSHRGSGDECSVDCPPSWFWDVLYDFSFTNVVAARRINVHYKDHDLRVLVVHDSCNSVILEIGSG
jgi:hypothetical protein